MFERMCVMKTVLAENLTELLKKNNMSQRELAEMVGVSDVSMSRYVNGDRMPKGPVLANMARALQTTSEDLLGQDTEKDPELAFYQIRRTIIRNAKHWTPEQKAELVNRLFGVK